MRRFLFSTAILLSSLKLCAAPYQSIFGSGSTAWVFRWSNLFPGGQIDSAYIEKDTVVNGVNYKKVVMKPGNSIFKGGLLREDVTTGQVWYRDLDYSHSLDPNDTLERVAFDFSLDQGDTFNITNESFNTGHADSFAVVDSVRILHGVKYIYFNRHLSTGEPYTIIEGIGSNLGILCKFFPSALIGHYLLCSYKDNQQTSFSNVLYKGDCHPYLSVAETGKNTSDIRLYPNPASDVLHIANNSFRKINTLKIISLSGSIVKQIKQPSSLSMPLSGIEPGYYFVELMIDSDERIFRPLVIQP